MKKNFFSCLSLAVAALLFAAAVPRAFGGEAPILSTTMDYLDIVMGTPESLEAGYLPLEVYEAAIKALAEAGYSKLNLRVNCCGLAFDPSNVVGRYGRDGLHPSLPRESACVIETCARYDGLRETVRLCHKYGMEVWCWDNPYESIGSVASYNASDVVRKYSILPLSDPFLRAHPEYLAAPRPGLRGLPTQEEVAARNQAVQGRAVGRIVLKSEVDRPVPSRLDATNLRLLVSDDNLNWRPYDGTFQATLTQEGKRSVITVTGLNIPQRYVKLASKTVFPKDKGYGLIFHEPRSDCHAVYDTEGKPLPAVWAPDLMVFGAGAPPESRVLSFFFNGGLGTCGIDYGDNAVGFCLGEPDASQSIVYLRGMEELHIPAVMEHKLARFAELAAYDFDGFVFCPRTHSWVVEDPDEWGFNPEVREKYLARTGVDIWDPDFKDTKALQAFRGEALDEYFRGCKRLAGKRPLYIEMPPPPERRDWIASVRKGGHTSWCPWGSLPFNWEKWVAEGIADGVGMIGWCDPAYFAAAKAKYNFKVVVFTKVKTFLKLTPEAGTAHLRDLRSLEGLDEIEMYESCILPPAPAHMQAVKAAVEDTSPVPGGPAEALKRVQEQCAKSEWL